MLIIRDSFSYRMIKIPNEFVNVKLVCVELSTNHSTYRSVSDMTFVNFDHPVQIGDPGHVVQIVESIDSAPKRTRNRRARPGRQRWIFGGIDQETKEAFLVEVPQRDAATLLPIIQQCILAGMI